MQAKINWLLILLTASQLVIAHGSNDVSITTDEQYRYIKSNGIPYTHGDFPNSNNPNSISEQNYNFRMPLYPMVSRITALQGFTNFGVAMDGIPFDPGTAEIWQNNDRNWRYEALSGKINLGIDQNNAHVQPNGAYHYHGLPTELLGAQSSSKHSELIGYAADGFPIYVQYGYKDPDDPNSGIKELHSSYKLRSGTRPSGPGGTYDGSFTQDYIYVAGAGDLDECNGRIGITPDYPNGTYTYFITTEFPLIPRCFKGTPDPSFNKQMSAGSMPGRNMQGGHRSPPPPPRRQ